jgi:hypothetical protein
VTPAEELRAAADRLDALDKAATPGPWDRWTPPKPRNRAPVVGTGIFYGLRADPDADLVAALRPVVGPLAAWLRGEATDAESYRTEVLSAPLAVARAVNGGAA